MAEQTYYYQFADGSVSVRTIGVSAGVVVEPQPPQGAVAIPAAVYETARAELEQASEVLLATLRDADQQRITEDYEALMAAGIPPATAQRMTSGRSRGRGVP